MNNAEALVSMLRTGGLRCKVGALLLSERYLGQERILATKLDIHCMDFAESVLQSIPPGAAFMALSVDKVLFILDSLANTRVARDCILLANFDLPFSKLSYEARMDIWGKLLQDFPYKRNSLILAFPGVLENSALIPEGSLKADWITAHRLISLGTRNS